MVGWHHRLSEPKSEKTPRDGGQGSPAGYIVHGVAKSQTQLSNKKMQLDENYKGKKPKCILAKFFSFLL